MFSRIFVELMSSKWAGSSSSITLPVMPSMTARLASLAALLSPARLNIMWFMDWMEPAAGAAL